MLHKNSLILISLFLVLALLLASTHVVPANAQGQDDEFPVTVELTGVIQSISSTQLVLTNGTVIKINYGTKDIAPGLQSGMTVVVVAEMDDEQFVAKSIQVAKIGSSTPATPSDAGKRTSNGKEKDKDKGQSKGGNDGVDDKNGNGAKGNGQDNGKGKDQAKDKGNSKADNAQAECLSRTDHPVATQLVSILNVSYTEILKWHCEGIGFGEIARAYVIVKNGKLTVEQIFAMRKAHKGWGQILQTAGLAGKDIAGLGKLKDQGRK